MGNEEEHVSEKKVVTIIGSLSREDAMRDAQKYFEDMGYIAYIPCQPDLQRFPLIEIQKIWINCIEQSDLIVTIPKRCDIANNGKSSYLLEFGESTSYEMAIAHRFGKRIIVW